MKYLATFLCVTFFCIFSIQSKAANLGDLDTSFATNGISLQDIDSSTDDIIYDMMFDDDGRIIAVGESDEDFLLMRFNTDGSLDDTFGTGGVVTTDMGTLTGAPFSTCLLYTSDAADES